MEKKIRLIASYLPQYYPTRENNEWWGTGFTEWTNVGKAKPLFKGHVQPRVPADLGYYDLRLPETRKLQAEMAGKFGIEGFCYWHYWFGNGKRVLERVFDEVLISREPDFPFCLGWANETWSGVWHGKKNQVLIEQLYPGISDYKAHFMSVLPAFQDNRYITVNGMPLFMLYRPLSHPEVQLFMEIWNDLAMQNGLPGVYFVGQASSATQIDQIRSLGFNAVNIVRLTEYTRLKTNLLQRGLRRLTESLNVVEYADAIEYLSGVEDSDQDCIPTLIPNWDHSPRSGSRALIFHNSTPDIFGRHIDQVFQQVKHKPAQERLVFIKSWNEWGEGNYLEPDLNHGMKYLEVLKNKVDKLII